MQLVRSFGRHGVGVDGVDAVGGQRFEGVHNAADVRAHVGNAQLRSAEQVALRPMLPGEQTVGSLAGSRWIVKHVVGRLTVAMVVVEVVEGCCWFVTVVGVV